MARQHGNRPENWGFVLDGLQRQGKNGKTAPEMDILALTRPVRVPRPNGLPARKLARNQGMVPLEAPEARRKRESIARVGNFGPEAPCEGQAGLTRGPRRCQEPPVEPGSKPGKPVPEMEILALSYPRGFSRPKDQAILSLRVGILARKLAARPATSDNITADGDAQTASLSLPLTWLLFFIKNKKPCLG
jgi:hypothetical protein